MKHLLLFSFFFCFVFCSATYTGTCFPTEDCWPTIQEINQFRISLNPNTSFIALGDPLYSTYATVMSTNLNKSPFYIIQVATVEDIQKVITFATFYSIRIGIKNTGHSYPGHATVNYGIVIDVSKLKAIEVEETFQGENAVGLMTVQAGVVWGEAMKVANDYNAVVVGGHDVSVGVSGYISGGGHGPVTRKYGLGVYNVQSITMVTASSEIVTCSETLNSDLFWAVRGGGGCTFGVIYNVTLLMHPASPVVVSLSVSYPWIIYPKSREDQPPSNGGNHHSFLFTEENPFSLGSMKKLLHQTSLSTKLTEKESDILQGLIHHPASASSNITESGKMALNALWYNSTFWQNLSENWGGWSGSGPDHITLPRNTIGWVGASFIYNGDSYQDAINAMQPILGFNPEWKTQGYSHISIKNETSLYDYLVQNADTSNWQRSFVGNVFLNSQQLSPLLTDQVLDTSYAAAFAKKNLYYFNNMVMNPVINNALDSENPSSVSPMFLNAYVETGPSTVWTAATEDLERMKVVSDVVENILYPTYNSTYLNEYTTVGNFGLITDFQSRFFGDNYAVLLSTKQKWDPCNRFFIEYGVGWEIPHNICPTTYPQHKK